MKMVLEKFSNPKVDNRRTGQNSKFDDQISNMENELKVLNKVTKENKLKEEKKNEDFKLQKAPKVMEDFEEDQVLIEKTLEYDLKNEETYNKEFEEVEEYYYLER